MELKRGLLVRSKAGHDKHGFLWCCRRIRSLRDLRRKAQAAPAAEKEKLQASGCNQYGSAGGGNENQS